MKALPNNITKITGGSRHHFFGYYGVPVWDITRRYIMALAVDFCDRPPRADDQATVGVIDIQNDCRFIEVTQTFAWNFQQGSLMHWNPLAPDREIVLNDRIDGKFVGVIVDIFTGKRRVISRAVYDPSHDGRFALGLNFARLNQTRPGYGYEGLFDPFENQPHPQDDGIHLIDLERNASRLVISLANVAARFDADQIDDKKLWFNHIMFNPDDSRFVFLARYEAPRQKSGAKWLTSMFTANPDGSELYCISKHNDISHFDWLDRDRLLVWTERRALGKKYYLCTDKTQNYEVIGQNVLPEDGHCCYRPDKKWILTDTYPDKDNLRTLILYSIAENKRIDIGRFPAPPAVWNGHWDIRVDLHPRWSRHGKQVCFDSSMDGSRQMYLADVSNIVK